MTPARRRTRRGLTLLELTLGLSVTAMVGLAIAGMLGVVSAGVSTHRDARSTMVRASTAQARLGAYVAPSRCVLDVADGTHTVVWLEDARGGETVHASEVRWLVYDAAAGTIDVHFVAFPDGWSEKTRALNDPSLPADSDWMGVLEDHEGHGWTASMPLIDGLSGVAVHTDAAEPLDSRHVVFDLEFTQESEPALVQVAATIRLHEVPE